MSDAPAAARAGILLHPDRWPAVWQAAAAVALAAAVGAILRLRSLDRITGFVFDEAYYVRDGASLWSHGFERALQLDGSKIVATDPSTWYIEPLTPVPVAHPPAGKWIIALGMQGVLDDPFRWRIAVVLCSVAVIVLTGCAGWIALRSVAAAALAATAMAVDGMAIVLGRTAILDGPLTAAVMAGVVLALLDLRWSARRRARDQGLSPLRVLRPWALAAAAAFGLAVAVKWSAAPVFLAALLVAWGADALARLRRDGRTALVDIGLRSLLSGLAQLAVAGAVYLAAWTGWLVSPDAAGRSWAADTGGYGGLLGLLPDGLQSLLHYHLDLLRSNLSITSPHPYQSPAWQWPLLLRPTLFYRVEGDLGGALCRTRCTQEVLSLPNPLLWYAAVIAAAGAIVLWAWRSRRAPAGMLIAAGLAAWAPWLLVPSRTIFQFYAILAEPFLFIALAGALAALLRRGRVGVAVAALFGLLTLAVALAYAPLVWGVPVSTAWTDALRLLPGWR